MDNSYPQYSFLHFYISQVDKRDTLQLFCCSFCYIYAWEFVFGICRKIAEIKGILCEATENVKTESSIQRGTA